MNIWRTLRDRLLRFTTHRKLAMAGDSTSASSEPASKDRVPLKTELPLEEWLKSVPFILDPAGCASKLRDQGGYRTVEDILIAGKPKSLARDTGLHPVDAWRIYAAAQEACDGVSQNLHRGDVALSRKRPATHAAAEEPSAKKRRVTVSELMREPITNAGGWCAHVHLAPWLMEHRGEKVRQARACPIPDARRVPDALPETISARTRSGLRSQRLMLEAQAATFTSWLSWTAVAFRKWRWTGHTQSTEYSRGVAQLLLLRAPGADEILELGMLPHYLHNWLQQGDEPCLKDLQSSMYGWTPLAETDVVLSEALLAALKRAAGREGKYHTFLPLRVQEVPDTVDLEEGLSEQAASALRILYAATQPLEEDPKSLRYEQFLMELGPIVRHQLTISIVIDFLRMALEVPAEEYLVLVPLISEAQHARGTFGNQKSDRVTWQQQMVSQIIVVINGLGSYKRTFILPVTAATQKSIADTAGMLVALSSLEEA
ncbi:g7958 [Coccomyxa viridis]|uniref:G7958 protein n=1 Tax=Coccomyxa viridis TaxID=1274662 RepID=A0ABP1G5P5_9CHLO